MGKTILLSAIIDFVMAQNTVSTALLQRHFRIGYGYAAEIRDYLEKEGAVCWAKNDPRPKLDRARLEALRQNGDYVFRSPAEKHTAKRVPKGCGTSLTFPIGISDKGTPVTADMAYVANLLIAGVEQTDVTRRCHAVYDALRQNAPDDTAYFWIAPGRDEAQYRAAWHLNDPVYTEKAAVEKCLDELCRQMETFYEYVRSHGNDFAQNAPRSRTFAFLDCEKTTLLSAKAKQSLWSLLVKGRAAGIHVILATTTKKSSLFDMIPWRIVCRTADRACSVRLSGRPGAETLADNEFFFCTGVGHQAPVKIIC